MRLIPAICLALAPLPALAACPADNLAFACAIGGKRLELCLTSTGLAYEFGPAGAPELRLDQGFAETGYSPWAGVGRAIHDEVIFQGEGARYTVWQSLDRLIEEGAPDPVWQGGVVVAPEGGDRVTLDCAPESLIAQMDRIGTALEAQGYCRDPADFTWKTACP